MLVLTYSRCRGVKIPKKEKKVKGPFHLRTENSNLKYKQPQQYERGNTDINIFGIAASHKKVR